MPKAPREDYPVCPKCGSPMAIAMMTSKGVKLWKDGEASWWYSPSAISIYCTSADCNHDLPAAAIPSPPPPEMK